MLKNLLLFIFLLVFNISFAVGTVGSEGRVNSPTKKVGFVQKIQKRLLTKRLNKLIEKMDTIDYDIINLHSGESINAYVLEINKNLVIYKNHDDVNSGIDSLTCVDVENVQLIDGTAYTCYHRSLSKTSPKANFINADKIGTDDNEGIGECDVITLYNGASFHANILEIYNKKVLFKSCNESDDIIDSLTCAEIEIIYLVDGSQYSCKHQNLPRRSKKANFKKSTESEMLHLNQQCDILILKNKNQLDVDIVAIKKDEILFRDCNAPSSEIESMLLADVRTYRKKNGYAQRVNLYPYETRSSYRSAISNSGVGNAIGTLLKIIVLGLLGIVALLLLIIALSI